MKIRDLLPVALGTEPADLIIKNGKILNIFTGDLEETNIAIYRKRIAGVGQYENGKSIIDAKGKIIVPGLIDAHLHIESSMLSPVEFAKAILPHGTTTIIADPHEIANVMGVNGIEYIIRATEDIPLDVYIGIPSAVPATNNETTGADISSDDMLGLVDKYPRRVIALGEVMNYPGVLALDRELITKIEIMRHKYKKIDGHAPTLKGKDLNAYLSAFIRSDHECTTFEEALEKVRRGMHIFIREGSAARNMQELIKAVNKDNFMYFSFCTDDRNPFDIQNEGHIDYVVRKAIASGVEPLMAIRMATINTAKYFDLRSMGAIAPGYKADMLFVDDLKNFQIIDVIKNGKIIVESQQVMAPIQSSFHKMPAVDKSFNIKKIKIEDLRIPVEGEKVRTIQIEETDLITHEVHLRPIIENGHALADPNQDMAKIAVFDRYQGKNMTLGFISGLGIKDGAIATSVGHDAHNLCVAGLNDLDMLKAAQTLQESNGGMAVVKDQKVLAHLAFPIAGLMSDQPADQVIEIQSQIQKALKEIGSEKDLFMTLSFVQLSVIPSIRITDQGLIDVMKQQIVPLWVN
ncbi:MAG: adenine deaminase [Spirochaetes bacterium]|nr:adenine deaminase [Spirochaetota bacterium]